MTNLLGLVHLPDEKSTVSGATFVNFLEHPVPVPVPVDTSTAGAGALSTLLKIGGAGAGGC